MWNVLADAVLILHLAFLAFIPLGGFLAWRWPRVIPLHVAAVPHGYDWLVQVVFAMCIVVSYVGLFVRAAAHSSRL